MEKTIYTAKNGEKITSMKKVNNRIVITIESEEKTWIDYAKELGYSVYRGLSVVDVPAIFKIALTIMDDLNGDWKPDFNDSKQCKFTFKIDNGKLKLDYYYSLQFSLFNFKDELTVEQFIYICGKEFIFKLYGR